MRKRRLADRRISELRVIYEALNRLDEAHAGRSESVNARAGILIAAATLSTSYLLQYLNHGWGIAGAVCGLIGVLIGLGSVFPHRQPILDIRAVTKKLSDDGLELGYRYLIEKTSDAYYWKLRATARRAWAVRIGFLLLAVSIIAVVFILVHFG
jgi:hypothetical protein